MYGDKEEWSGLVKVAQSVLLTARTQLPPTGHPPSIAVCAILVFYHLYLGRADGTTVPKGCLCKGLSGLRGKCEAKNIVGCGNCVLRVLLRRKDLGCPSKLFPSYWVNRKLSWDAWDSSNAFFLPRLTCFLPLRCADFTAGPSYVQQFLLSRHLKADHRIRMV